MNGFSLEEIERLNQMSREKSELAYAKREGIGKGRREARQKILAFIAKGCTLEELADHCRGAEAFHDKA